MNPFLIRWGSLIGLCVVTLLVLSVTALFWWQGRLVENAKTWVVHTHTATEHIEILINKITEAMLGERGFVLTGDEHYLRPYYDAVTDPGNADLGADPLVQHHSILQEVAFLQDFTADNPVQQRSIGELNGILKDILERWDLNIGLRRKEGEAALKTFDPSLAQKMLDRIRAIIAAMTAEEARMLKQRTSEDEAAARLNDRIMYGGILLFYIGMSLAVWLATRHWARAKIAEAEVYEKARLITIANEELEEGNEKLRNYAEDLKRNGEELKAQQEELEAANEEMEEKNDALEEQNAQIREQTRQLAQAKKLAEEQAEAVARASTYKSEFLANMSHELRTPLNSLLILAKGLASNEEGNLTAEQVEEAGVIHGGGLELLGLINDILDLSKVEAGKIVLMPEDMPFQQVVQRLQQQFAPLSRQSGVAFHVEVARDLPSHMHTDAQRLEQILKNLLSNAFKFTKVGSITLQVARANEAMHKASSQLDGDAVAFSVSDTGIGIESSKLKEIFEAFRQEDGSTDRHYGGTGLGLTIARKFAHLLGGEIHVESVKGAGSTFTLLLPLTRAIAAATPQEEPLSYAAVPAVPSVRTAEAFIPDDRERIGEKDKVILVIEDDRDFADVVMKIARRYGYRCLAAGDGGSGLSLATAYRVSAIILDLRLPDMDGMSVLDYLKADARTRHIPVHIITGRDTAYSNASLRKGAIGYLTKPVDREALESVFSRIEQQLQVKVKKLLVIEDDEGTQCALESLLRKKNIDITFCGEGADALVRARGGAYDCIILDLNLPDMSGFEWIEALEKDLAGQPGAVFPPVVIYTARDLTSDENLRLSRLASGIVLKGGTMSSERLLDEVTLFLHSIEPKPPHADQLVHPAQPPADKALVGKTVLLVDDDLRNTFALSKPLKKEGLNVIIADNGQMALEKIKEETPIDMIIIDIMMPVMDGYQAMKAIRAQKRWGGIPIIALTARAMPEEQEKCMAAGANDYMTKPVDVARLMALIRLWIFKQGNAA